MVTRLFVSIKGYNAVMFLLSVLIGKTIIRIMHMLGQGGGALPGLIVERTNRRFLPKAMAQLPHGSVIITGTNGKTTTTKLLTELLQAHGLRVLTNETGSNFVRGTVASVLNHISWSGSLDYDIAVFELDEAYARQFSKIIAPTGVVGLNILRDQMDRFGEIDTTAKYVQQTASTATKWLVLNANDPRIARAAEGSDAAVTWFGHAPDLVALYAGDDQHHDNGEIVFYQAAEPQIMLVGIAADGNLQINSNGATMDYTVKLTGSHNAINITAALAALQCILPEADKEASASVLAQIKPAFGRGEVLKLSSGLELRLQLVKNPSGFTHALRMADDETNKLFAIAINDDYADGRDVSWLWDVDFTGLQGRTVIVSGSRGTDMAVRLKYDEVAKVTIARTLDDLTTQLSNSKDHKHAIVYCTYTAMLRIRKLLQQSGVSMERVDL